MKKAIYSCQNCRKEFTARVADRKRGWARFCCKSCKASEQERRTGQYSKFSDIIFCGPIDYS